jgi:type I restriction enzyme S subunit
LSWSSIVLEDACEKIIDYRGKTPKKSEKGIRLVTAKVIKGGRINDEPAEYIPESDYDQWMTRGIPKRDDILITTEAPLGEVAILRTDEKIALAQRTIL